MLKMSREIAKLQMSFAISLDIIFGIDPVKTRK